MLAGEYITLGWNYYSEREFIVKALVDFDAKQDLEDLRQRLLEEDESFDLGTFYEKASERWLLLGMAEPVEKIHSFLGARGESYGIEEVQGTKEWTYRSNGSSQAE